MDLFNNLLSSIVLFLIPRLSGRGSHIEVGDVQMKRLTFLVMLLSFLSGIPSFAKGKQKDKVLIILREGDSPNMAFLLTQEFAFMRDQIEQAGFEPVVASVSGQPITDDSVTVKPDLKLHDVSVDDYIGVMVPCLAVRAAPAPQAVTVIQKAAAQGKPIAAQRGSVATLAEAGVLRGKKYAAAAEPSLDQSPAFQGATFAGTGVVRDGNVVTSGVCPLAARELELQDGTAELTRAFIDSLGR